MTERPLEVLVSYSGGFAVGGALSLILRSLRNDHDQRDASKQSVYVWACVCEEEDKEEGGWAVSCARQHE